MSDRPRHRRRGAVSRRNLPEQVGTHAAQDVKEQLVGTRVVKATGGRVRLGGTGGEFGELKTKRELRPRWRPGADIGADKNCAQIAERLL